MSSPIEFLSNLCGEMREISGNIKAQSPEGVPLDIPDVLDAAVDMLTQIVQSKTGFDPNENIFSQLSAFDELLLRKEQEFRDKMKLKLDAIDLRMVDLQVKLEQSENAMDAALSQSDSNVKQGLAKIDEKNLQTLSDIDKLYEEKKRELDEQQREAFEKFEKNLAVHLSDLSKEWTKKLEAADEKISSHQKQLQQMIHNKHSLSQNKNEMLLAEDRRMAAEHEKISREFKDEKDQAESKIRSLSGQLRSLTQQVQNQNDNATNRMEVLEEALRKDRMEIEDKHTAELNAVNEEIEEFSRQAETLRLELEGERANAQIRMRELEKSFEGRIAVEEGEISKMVACETTQLKEKYLPEIENLDKLVREAEYQRGVKLEEMRKSVLESVEGDQQEIKDLEKKHIEERNKLKEQLQNMKDELTQMIADKHADLEGFKHQKQQELGATMEAYDVQEKTHADEISRVMQQFDDQQEKLAALHRMLLEQSNNRKAEELAQLKREHEQRKNQILLKLEQQMKLDAEQEVAAAVSQAQANHAKEVTSIKGMILDIKGRMDLLQMKIEGLQKIHSQRFEEIQILMEEKKQKAATEKEPEPETETEVRVYEDEDGSYGVTGSRTEYPSSDKNLPTVQEQETSSNTILQSQTTETATEAPPQQPESMNTEPTSPQEEAESSATSSQLPDTQIIEPGSSQTQQQGEPSILQDPTLEDRTNSTPKANDSQRELPKSTTQNQQAVAEAKKEQSSSQQMSRNNTEIDLHKSAELKEKLLSEKDEATRRKELVLKEADEINQNFQEIHDKFEQRMRNMEAQFSRERQALDREYNRVELQKKQIANHFDDQKLKLQQISELADVKQQEADLFENDYSKQRDEFHEKTKSEYENRINEIRMKPREFELEMEDLRKTLSAQMEVLQEQLKAAKETTHKTSELMLIKRSQALEEAEMELRISYDEKEQQIMNGHTKRLEKLKEDMANLERQHKQNLADIERTFTEQLSGNRKQTDDLLRELEEERMELEGTAVALDAQIEELSNRECPGCSRMKDLIKQLIRKRDILEARLARMKDQVKKSDAKVNQIFHPTAIRKSQPLITAPVAAKKINPLQFNFH